jgi:hypothetical protein
MAVEAVGYVMEPACRCCCRAARTHTGAPHSRSNANNNSRSTQTWPSHGIRAWQACVLALPGETTPALGCTQELASLFGANSSPLADLQSLLAELAAPVVDLDAAEW